MVKRLLLFLINIYQRFISPMFPPVCRFHPSCSTYALQAVEKYGPGKGCLLALWRLMRCNPFHPGGIDPLN